MKNVKSVISKDVPKQPDPPSKPKSNGSTLAQRAHAQANAKFFSPENAGDFIEGVVLAIKQDMGKYGSTHYHIQQDDGTVSIISATPESVLGGKISGEHVNVGDRLYVEFLGEKTSKSGSTYKDWAVAAQKGDTPPPPDNDIPFPTE